MEQEIKYLICFGFVFFFYKNSSKNIYAYAMSPSVDGSPSEVSVRAESIDLQFAKPEVFEGQPKFHLVSQQQSLEPESIYLVPRGLKIHFYI